MKFLTISTTTGNADAAARLSAGGLVDCATAAAEDVVLWTDPQTRVAVERAVTASRLITAKRLRVA